MRFGLTDFTMEKIIEALLSFDAIESASIFGSRAMGNYKPGSDVDIVVYGREVDFDLVTKLSNLLNEIMPLPYYFDVLCYDLIESSALKRHIDMFGLKIFER